MFKTTDTTYGGQKYAGRSRAVVLDNVDPLKRGRIRVKSPILGETVWIPYLTIPGSFTVPEVGDIVYIECDGGYESHPIAWGTFIKGADSDPNIPQEFQRNSPTNRGFYSPGGHLIEIDDGSDAAGTNTGIRITTSGGNKITIAEDPNNEQGLITLETSGGATLEIDGTKDTITTSNSAGATVTLSPDKIDITDSLGNEITLDSSGIKATEVAGGELNLSTGKVALGNSTIETIDVISQTLGFLFNAFTDLSTTTAAGFGAPISSVAQFAALATQAQTLKTQVDTLLKGSL